MTKIILSPEVNYIGVFLTLRCNLNCPYCLNKQSDFVVPTEMSTEDWIKGLSRLTTRQDLPISLQGGEPTIFNGFCDIANTLHEQGQYLDLLTNGMFDLRNFNVSPFVFQRKAPYASIRFSYHPHVNPVGLAMKVWQMQNEGYEVGIWGLSNNDNIDMQSLCKVLNIDFRIKEYLDPQHGTYKYPEAINGEKKTVQCKGSELLFGPSGHVFRCHSDLYSNTNPIGHILDLQLPMPGFRSCTTCGCCNPCDIKLKTNRLQEGGHCSVTIKW